MPGKHLTYTSKLKLEALYKAGTPVKQIAKELNVHFSTIYRELKRGEYTCLNHDWTERKAYSPEISEQNYRAGQFTKGADLKIGKDRRLAEYIENKIIKEKYSPAAVLGEIKRKGLKFDTEIRSVNTIYSYIYKGVFLHLTNKDLPRRKDGKQTYKHIRAARPPRGETIENRPEVIGERSSFGNWEMDTVVSYKGGNGCALVLTERLTRHEVIMPLRDKTSNSVVKSLDSLERKYGKMFYRVFKTITVDNGSEFADCKGMEKAKYRKGSRTKIYYCHPYSAYERGSNENQNAMIRRHFPKGTDFSKISRAEFKRVQDWLNNYPRKMFNFYTSNDLFEACLNSLK